EESFFASFWTALGQEYNLDPTHIARLIDRPYTDFVLAYPDAAPLLAALRAHGVRIGVLSNFSLFSLDESLASTGLAAYVDVAHAATIRGHAKPQDAAYLSIAQALAVSPAACLFIDDEMPCVAGAAATGMRAIWLDRTRVQTSGTTDSVAHSPTDFQTAWADGVLADLVEVDALLEAIGRGGKKAQ
ncbi:MAG: HAD family hydrolase, partial [Litorilinea sp.]